VQIKLQLFETLWKQSIPASKVFTSLEESSPPEVTNQLEPNEAEKLLFKLIENSKYRVDIIIPTKVCLQFLIKKKLVNRLETALKQGVKVRLLIPKEKQSFQSLNYLDNTNFEVKEVNDIRAKRIVLLSDNQSSLSIEINDSRVREHTSPLSKAVHSTGSVALMTLSILFGKQWS
jgi:phosphatidylserine/phosphatidylglycerophosphate/cardiolipin synthase-like enzyme